MSTSFSCPQCKKLLTTANPLPAGTRIKCPQCATVFAPSGSAAAVAAVPRPPAPPTSPPASSAPSAAAGSTGVLRPSKSLDAASKSASKGVAVLRAGVQKAKSRPMLAAGVAAGVAAAFLFLCTGGIGALYLVFRSKPAQPAPMTSVTQGEETPPAPEPPPKKKRKKYTSDSPTRMAPETLQKVKRSTVYIRVVDGNGEGGTGSGFFAYETGIVLTNAHVVGMMEADSKPPRRIDVILNSGEKDERNLTGEVVAVDSQTDVAVIRLSTKDNLPQPLEVISAEELVETQPVYICGFPFGERIGKNITVSPSQVSSLRKSATGDLTQVQVNGGMNPGNSGGPVVDTDGDVVGVAVAGIRGSSINFAIPGDSVEIVLNGQIKNFQLGTPSRRGSNVVVPVTITTSDPLKRIRRVAVDWWEGKQGRERPSSHQPPAAEAGDSEHRTLSLKYDSGVARGELVLPATASGTFWIQPAYAGDGYHHWMTANPYMPDLVDAKPATLAIKQPTQPVKSRLSSRSRFRLRNDDGQEHSVIRRISGRLTEASQPGNPQGNVDCRIKIRDLEMVTSRDSRGEEPDDRLGMIRPALDRINLTLVFDVRGNLVRRTGEFAGVPVQNRREAERFCGEILNTLDCVTVPPPPNPSLQPGNGWRTNKAVPIDTMRGVPMGQLDLTYTYRGTRLRNGNEEAVVAFKGPLINTRGMTGSATGHAAFDLKKGQFVQVKADVEITMSVLAGGQIVKAIGNTEVYLDRDPE
jgi:S1-C subfamily serine protease